MVGREVLGRVGKTKEGSVMKLVWLLRSSGQIYDILMKEEEEEKKLDFGWNSIISFG